MRGRTPSKARGAGGPFVPCPRSGTGARGPGAKRRAETWGQRFWLLFWRLQKVTRPGGRNKEHPQNSIIS
ncbi:hypothetical protein SB11R_15735 [Pseudomonas oryzihabitans]|nr:hypothetical protein SB11R_15735 [Pseudomonas psychrotolerans]